MDISAHQTLYSDIVINHRRYCTFTGMEVECISHRRAICPYSDGSSGKICSCTRIDTFIPGAHTESYVCTLFCGTWPLTPGYGVSRETDEPTVGLRKSGKIYVLVHRFFT